MNPDLFAQTAQSELVAWENYKKRYTAQVPPPAKASIAIWQTIGWQLVLILLQAIGAIGLAALRTAEMFFLASAGANLTTRRAEAVLAILAIEFGIVVFAAIRAESDNRNLSDDEKLNTIKVSTWWLVVGEVVMLAISIVAGLGVSFNGFNVGIDFSGVLAVTIGAGASIVAAVAGMVIGAMLARWSNVRDAADIKYRNAYADWEQGLRDSWDKSPDKQIVENQMKLVKRSLPKELVRSFDGERTPEHPNERMVNTEKRDAIWQYLTEHSTDEFIPGPSEVARELGITKGSVIVDTIKEFRAKKPTFAPQQDELVQEILQ
jgi:hypothetical protein